MMGTPAQTAETLLNLAPLELRNRRVRRYHGEDQCVPLRAFTAEDQEHLVQLYHYLQGLLAALSPSHNGSRGVETKAYLEANSTLEVVELAQQFGRTSSAADRSPMLLRVIHDIRGGGLTPLLGQLQLAELRGTPTASLEALYFLTRDHLKIMRNALLGLDDPKREEDLRPKAHGTDFIVEKWSGATLHEFGRQVRLEVECPQPTGISECCVEFGALDRILYNLINNACRHTAADFIRLVLLPVPDPQGENLRFVLLNPVASAARENLAQMDMASLFQEGTSSTGSGYGLAIATDFVGHAYGVSSPEALEGGYLGATLLGDFFAAWFHWPRLVED